MILGKKIEGNKNFEIWFKSRQPGQDNEEYGYSDDEDLSESSYTDFTV
jgi:hypothetical protein